jgi:hypothetical protein
MQTITFYSYKGGVGRSLVLANVAHYLARFGQKVVVLDLDLEAPGLHYKLLPQREEGIPASQGLVDYLDTFIARGHVPPHIQEYVVPVPLHESIVGRIHLIPAGRAPSADYWRKLSRLNLQGLFHREDAPGIPLFLDLKERIREVYAPDVFLIDARTGITEIGGVATTILADQVVCMLLNNAENLEGARTVLRGLKRAPRPPGTESPIRIIPVLSRLPSTDSGDLDEEAIDKVRAYLNARATNLEDTLELDEPIVLHADRTLEKQERLLVERPEEYRSSPLLRDYLRLFARLIPHEILHSHIGAIIERARNALFTDPDGAQREIESLAELSGRPEALRALLTLYRVRNVDRPAVVLPVAQRLWEITRDPMEPLVSGILARHSKHEGFWKAPHRPSLAFLEDVFRARSPVDAKSLINLARSLAEIEQYDRTERLLLDLAKEPNLDVEVLADAITILTEIDRIGSALRVFGRVASQQRNEAPILTAWARVLVRQDNSKIPGELLEALDVVAKEAPDVALDLIGRTKDKEFQERWILAILDNEMQQLPGPRLERVGRWFIARRRFDQFRRAFSRRWGTREPEFLARLERSAPTSEPYSRELEGGGNHAH